MSNLARLEALKIDLRSLLVSRNSQDITLPLLNELYKDIADEDIPYTDFNYTSLKQFLESMPEILYLKINKNKKLCAYHVDTERSRHISRLVSLERKKSPQSKKTFQRNNAVNPRELKQILSELCDSTPQSDRNKKVKKSDVLSTVDIRNGGYAFYTTRDLNNQLNELNHVLYYDDNYIYFKSEVSENRIKKKTNNTNKDLAVENAKFEQIKNFTKDNSVTDMVKYSTILRLQKLIEKFPEGIKCWELPKIYQHEYKLDLEYSDLGFNSILEFIGVLPDIFKIVTRNGQHFILCTEILVNSSENHQTSNLTSEDKFSNSSDEETKPLPEKLFNKILYHKTIDQLCITSFLTSNQNNLDVKISEVHNPSFFWVQPKKNTLIIDKLMKNLQEFYTSQNLNNYKIPPVFIKLGLHVACKFDDQWHRGIVMKEINSKKRKIHFYDFGTNEIYDLQNLYYLDEQFFVIPAQAITCTLENVKPIGSEKWSLDHAKKFTERIFNKYFVAYIGSIDNERNVLTVNLIDTNGSNHVNINYWTIEHNIAEWGTAVTPKNIFTLKYYNEYTKNLGLKGHLCNSVETKEKGVNQEINTGSPKAIENRQTSINRISSNKKLEILRRYKENILNKSLGSSSIDSNTSENATGL